MPARIAGVSYADAYALLRRFGWRFSHQVGSHVHLVNDAGEQIVIPRHSNADINPGMMGLIVADAGINPDHFLWGLGRADRRGRRAPRGWRPGQPD